MYLKTYTEVVAAFESVTIENYADFFMIVKEASPIEKMMVQRLKRVVNDVEISFLSIRDIKIEDSFQKQGIFSRFLSILEQKNIPVMIDDIVNDKLDDFLMRRGYHAFSYEKYGEKVRARYLTK